MQPDGSASLRLAAGLGVLGLVAAAAAFFFLAGLAMSGWSPGRATIAYDVVGTVPPWLAGVLLVTGAAIGTHGLRTHWGSTRRPVAALFVGLEASAGLLLSALAAQTFVAVVMQRDVLGRTPLPVLLAGTVCALGAAVASYLALRRRAPGLVPVGRLVVSAIVAVGTAGMLALWWLSFDHGRRRERRLAERDSAGATAFARASASAERREWAARRRAGGRRMPA